jgi:hypothetical protein
MRTIDVIVIYLAAGAPFGALRLVQGSGGLLNPRNLLQAVSAAFVWPSSVLSSLRRQRRLRQPRRARPEAHYVEQRASDEVCEARNHAVVSLNLLQDRIVSVGSDHLANISRDMRDALEKHIELTFAVAESSADDMPDDSELELFRVAGRKDEDLHIGGRCIHRRNVARLQAHLARSGLGLRRALSELCRLIRALDIPVPGFEHRTGTKEEELAVFLAGVNRVLTLLKDDASATAVAQLLDREYKVAEHDRQRSDRKPEIGEEECSILLENGIVQTMQHPRTAPL